MLLKKVGAWKELGDVFTKLPGALEKAAKTAVLQEAQFLRTEIVKGITTQAPAGRAFDPLSSLTLATRKAKGFKGSKALLVRADLRNSISVKQSGDGVFIGVQRSAVGPGGKKMVDIAEIHEFGSKPILIEMTPKMRRFLMMAFRQAGVPYAPGKGTGIMVTRIPARPFFRPVFEKFGPGSKKRIESTMVALLKGVLSE